MTCGTAVVTLGVRGCVAQAGALRVAEPAVPDVLCVDSTGAGDLFAAGFIFGLINDLTLATCARLGCLSGAAVVRVRSVCVCLRPWLLLAQESQHGRRHAARIAQGYGASVSNEAWTWARSKLPGVLILRNVPAAAAPEPGWYAPAHDASDAPASQTDSC